MEKQPPQVMKKDNKFSASVRILFGGKLNVHVSSPTMYATIVSEEQARAIVETNDLDNVVASGCIKNNTAMLNYFYREELLMATFSNLVCKMFRST